jgi:3-methyladenine DNA glycosylase AlkC
MAELLKDLFSKEFVDFLGSELSKNHKEFNKKQFIDTVFNKNWEDYELKQRMRHISICFNNFLQIPYTEQLFILKKVKKELSLKESMELQAMVFQDFVEVYGLNDFEKSILALEVFTINSSSEFAIRQFILKYEDKTMRQISLWAKSSNEHIRRLASEGCRPRLPWATSLPSFKKDPSLIFPILEELKNDESSYVRRSVANNLNDIAKDNPSLVIDFIKENIGFSKNCDSLLKHAARTLLKKGDVQTLDIFGYKKIDDLNVNNFILENEVWIGSYLNFSFNLENKTKLGLLRLEYEVDFKMSNDRRSKKVYMISQSDVKSKGKEVNKKHSFKVISTRTYYPGIHYITLIVNGIRVKTEEFILKN